jgi:hypothetical protein
MGKEEINFVLCTSICCDYQQRLQISISRIPSEVSNYMRALEQELFTQSLHKQYHLMRCGLFNGGLYVPGI